MTNMSGFTQNAPAVFQRLMQKVLSGLNPEEGKQFVVAYLDDILVFSTSLQDHLVHLWKVINHLKSVEYLGHLITSKGLQTNYRLTETVQNFPTPKTLQDVQRFLSMASYYCRFIANFAKIVQPLHHLTTKSVIQAIFRM